MYKSTSAFYVLVEGPVISLNSSSIFSALHFHKRIADVAQTMFRLLGAAFVVVLLLLADCGEVQCHTKGLRLRRRQKNSTQAELAEQQFMRWVRFVGGLRHSVFGRALNKAFPSYTLTVDKKPSGGDFTTIQAAVDSLPLINLVRVVIKVNAGTYT